MNKSKRVKPVRHRLHVKSGETVKVITGSFRGVQGKILSVNTKTQRVIVDGVGKLKKAVRQSAKHVQGGIIEIDRPIHVSNVKKVDNTVPSNKTTISKSKK